MSGPSWWYVPVERLFLVPYLGAVGKFLWRYKRIWGCVHEMDGSTGSCVWVAWWSWWYVLPLFLQHYGLAISSHETAFSGWCKPDSCRQIRFWLWDRRPSIWNPYLPCTDYKVVTPGCYKQYQTNSTKDYGQEIWRHHLTITSQSYAGNKHRPDAMIDKEIQIAYCWPEICGQLLDLRKPNGY